MMNFRRVQIEDRANHESFLNADSYINNHYYASELNFSNLFCWNVSDNIFYNPTPDAIYIMAKDLDSDSHYFLPPLVKQDEDFAPAMAEIEAYMQEKNMPFFVRSLTTEMKEVLEKNAPGRYLFTYNRDYSEYLYAPQDLISVAGKKFAQKRNHLNYFYNNYAYTFRPYELRDRQSIINLVNQWKMKVGNTEILESTAIDNAIAYYAELGLQCSVLEAEGQFIAFCIGFINRNQIGIVMFEKANTEFRGAFNAINNLFVKEKFADCLYVNRQEDMGLEGLRRAKLDYNPVSMADKFDAVKA